MKMNFLKCLGIQPRYRKGRSGDFLIKSIQGGQIYYICKSVSYGINIKWPPGGATKLTWPYIQVYRSWMAMKPKVGKLVKWSSDMISKVFQNMPPPINQF